MKLSETKRTVSMPLLVLISPSCPGSSRVVWDSHLLTRSLTWSSFLLGALVPNVACRRFLWHSAVVPMRMDVDPIATSCIVNLSTTNPTSYICTLIIAHHIYTGSFDFCCISGSTASCRARATWSGICHTIIRLWTRMPLTMQTLTYRKSLSMTCHILTFSPFIWKSASN